MKTYQILFLSLCFIAQGIQAQELFDAAMNTNKAAKDSVSQLSSTVDLYRQLRWWEADISKKPFSWYKTQEGVRMTENLLSWQDNGTGWPLMNTVMAPNQGEESKGGPWGKKASLYNASYNEIRFLVRAYQATKNERYLEALRGGLDYLLDAQHASGAWPKSYPWKEGDYARYACFNDNVFVNLMSFMAELTSFPEYRIIGEERLERAKKAYEKGLDFILKSQIKVDDKLTAWPQQCDHISYEARSARPFEPVSIAGGESKGVLLFLMSIRKPSAQVIQAVEAGVQWYREVQIDGMELIKDGNDQKVIPNPKAPPLWARFYEIGTNKALFAGRDGIVKYNLAEIEPERRKGYAWYNYNGTELFERYKEWKRERLWDHQAATNTDESKVLPYTLPDPLLMQNGRRVKSVKNWVGKRRPEILSLFEQNQHGKTPETTIKASYEIMERDAVSLGGLARRTQARIRFSDNPEDPLIRVLVNVPAHARGPVPCLLHISFSPNIHLYDEAGIDEGEVLHTRFKIKMPDRDAMPMKDINPEHFIGQGYAVATVYYGDIEPDFDGGKDYGIRRLFNDSGQSDPWGAIGAWAWGLSRVLDYLETEPAIDATQVAVSGVSRLGKAVLWTAAQDERFAMAIPIVSGEGGAAISRRNFGETIADLSNPHRYDYWYTPRYAGFAFNPMEIPVDGHMLLSLIAPRPLLQIVGINDTWSDPKGEWLAAKAAEPVYELHGLKGMETADFPRPDTLILNDMGFFMHNAGHGVFQEDYQAMTDFMNKHFTGQAAFDRVSLSEDEKTFTLSNGIITARVSKESGDMISLIYKGVETLTGISGHPFVYWSHDVKTAKEIKTSISIHPSDNDGQRAEVSVKGISGGNLMGKGPGAPPEGDLAVDIEIRYCLSKADQGVYTYCIFEHRPEYDAGDFTEARLAAKLQPFFNYMHVDDDRTGPYPLFNEGWDKYVYTALQWKNRAYGFSSPEKGLGWFMMLPSPEFLSGGPSKAEFLAHGIDPTVLCYWRSSHYRGASLILEKGEEWSKVVGPLFIYVNEGQSPEAMWNDAKRRLKKEEQAWPFDWVKNAAYIPAEKRSAVYGQLILNDAPAELKKAFQAEIYVGLTRTPYKVKTPEGELSLNWHNDAKYNQYWTKSQDPEGRFYIQDVPAGKYTLSAFADGVLGELTQSDIIIPESGQIDLGKIVWTPVRRGKQVWDIGLANRSAAEFAGGDDYFRPGQALRYAAQFAANTDYTIGESDYSSAWYYAQMPYANDSSKIIAFTGMSGTGEETSRNIRFTMDKACNGRAWLRIALCGTGADPRFDVLLNGELIKQIDPGISDGALYRHQIHGIWRELELAFDAKLLRAGANTISLVVPKGSLNNGVIYDYIRLELHEK